MVIQYKTALQFEGLSPSAEEIRKKTGAGNALEGAIRTTEAGLEIRIELRNLERRSIVFSRVYPSTEKDMYSDLDNISKAVAENLGVRSVHTRYPGIKPRGSTDPRVNRYYAYGLSFQDAYFIPESEADFAACIDNYRKALQIDPGFSLAYWQLGIVYEVKYNLEKRESDEEEMVRMWRRAYDCDPDLAEANLAMGWIYFNQEDHKRAFPFFSRAYELESTTPRSTFISAPSSGASASSGRPGRTMSGPWSSSPSPAISPYGNGCWPTATARWARREPRPAS